MKWIYLLLLPLLAGTACSKSGNASDDRAAPAILISNPAEGQSFTAGSVVAVGAGISDAGRIVQVHLHISNQESGQLLMDVHRYPGESTFSLSESFTVPGTGNFRIRVIARDNSGNESYETVNISSP